MANTIDGQGTGRSVAKKPTPPVGSGVRKPSVSQPFSALAAGVPLSSTPQQIKQAQTGNSVPFKNPAASIGPSGPSGPGGNIGTNSTGQAGVVAPTAPAAPDESWFMQDPTYLAESGGYKNTLDAALANLLTRRAGYDTDFVQTLKNLGWNWGGAGKNDLGDVAGGSWDAQNQLGAYGSGLQNLVNDFAGRGMLGSSFFGTAQNNFNTDFNNQFAGLQGQRANQQQGFADEEAAANAEYKNALARARQNAAARFGAF